MTWFPESKVTSAFAVNSLYISVGGFVLLYAFKAVQDPNFCRSEKHIETVKKMEMAEQKGDLGPTPIDLAPTEVITNPQRLRLPGNAEGGAS